MRLTLYFALIFSALTSCDRFSLRETRLSLFKSYHEATQRKDGSKWAYMADTVRTWFDDMKGKPVTSVKGAIATGKWAQWDSVMHSKSYFDTLWYEADEGAIKGYFYEDNDFYQLIGRPPNKTLRTYWFDQQNKITQILIHWIAEENTTSDVFLKPITEWAQQYHPDELDDLYAHQTIVPSTENAVRWKVLLNKYRLFKDSLN